MNVTTMRRIDCWLGMPVCFFLTCWRCCFGRRMPKGSDKPQRILFIKLRLQLAYPFMERTESPFESCMRCGTLLGREHRCPRCGAPAI